MSVSANAWTLSMFFDHPTVGGRPAISTQLLNAHHAQLCAIMATVTSTRLDSMFFLEQSKALERGSRAATLLPTYVTIMYQGLI